VRVEWVRGQIGLEDCTVCPLTPHTLHPNGWVWITSRIAIMIKGDQVPESDLFTV
jgi:hypothetical protein